jgi:hypothetical protein
VDRGSEPAAIHKCDAHREWRTFPYGTRHAASLAMKLRTFFALSLLACGSAPPDGSSDESSGAASAADDGYENDPARVGSPAPKQTLGPEYTRLAAADKRKALWDLVSADEYCVDMTYDDPACRLPRGKSFSFTSLASLVSLDTTFDTVSDEMPEGRRKLLRPSGIVAAIAFEASYPDQPADPAKSSRTGPYTGLFAPNRGPVAGIARFSDNGVKSFNPAVALKFFVDGKPSVNTLAAISMDGQGDDHNFFAGPITNHLQPAHGLAAKVVWAFFKIAKSDPSLIELDNLAGVHADGTEVPGDEVRAPFELRYVGHGDLATRFSSAPHEYRVDLHALPAGTVVYDVLARASAADPATSFEKIGEITLTEKPVATRSGDGRLFFQHHRGAPKR